jgi:cytidine deaminase
MPKAQYTSLINAARRARLRSYSPYSGFRVGAALLTRDGKIITGCNIEISTYALTLCAERTAVFKARSEGHTQFKAIAIATAEKDFTPPCGACRQVLMDLAGDVDVVLVRGDGHSAVWKLSELLPLAFGPANLEQRERRK